MIDIKKLWKLSADLICTIDRQGRFVDVSDASLAILGYAPAELRGRYYTDFIDPTDIDTAAEALGEVVSGTKLQIQNHYRHKKGQIVPLRWSAQWDEAEQLLYAIARSGQITDREEAMRTSLEESNQRYQYVSQATSDAIWDWDIVKGTLYWGENFQSIFGYNRADINPGIDSWTAHIYPDDAKRIARSIQAILKGKETIWKEEYRYRRADGTFANVVDRGFVIRNKAGAAVRMVGAMHDISERKLALQEMKRITDDLYKHNRELHEFGYIVSHNLRSPVANIMGIATLLEIEKDDPETVSFCTHNLKSSIARLDEVIQDLSKILSTTDSSVELILERVDLAETIRHVKTDLADKILQNQARIDVTPKTFPIYSHKAYIYSVFFNLIANSLKYRSEKVPVISIHLSRKEATDCIVFTDNGCGIDLERHGEELFKPYKRFHTHVEGKGLGLFLVKSHVEALGGKISVVSAPAAGATFTIGLPKRSGVPVT
jgi:PAS domain S-box-containing protein